MAEKEVWLIGISGNEMDDVVVQKVVGTKNQVKKYLVSLVKKDRVENEDGWGSYFNNHRRIIFSHFVYPHIFN